MYTVLKKHIDYALLVLILIALVVNYTNYTPGTFLSGWDTLHPEFDFGEYVKRIISLWQRHQGLGAPPSQAHLSELPRILIVRLFMFLFPLSFIRYAYFFLMIVMGPVGVYLFLRYVLEKDQSLRGTPAQIGAFLGGLFYLLNLGTMQHFAVPLEMFATKFGFLGFLYVYSIKFLYTGKKKYVIIFSLFTIFSSSMAHTATLWYIYAVGLAVYLFALSFLHKRKDFLKKTFLLIGITIALNLYWILPNAYYTLYHNSAVINSKIHRLFTEEAFLHSKNYGSWKDVLFFKNFLFDWRVPLISSGDTYPFAQELLAPWTSHLRNPYVSAVGYLFGLLWIAGVVLVVIKRKILFLGLIPFFLISIAFLLPNQFPFSFFFEWARQKSPFLQEVFRFPFTKFSLSLIFFASIFSGFIHSHLTRIISTLPIRKIRAFCHSLYLYLFIALIIYSTLPVFSGNFINKIVRVPIPQEYFSLFEWSKKQDRNRMLMLPIHTVFGWTYYTWNTPPTTSLYQGAGFAWFGLRQPLLNREFDRWYRYNEQSYREISYAVYSKNTVLFEKLLEKYNIRYILLDKNVVNPGSGQYQTKKLFYPELIQLLTGSPSLRLVQTFGEKIQVFEYIPTRNDRALDTTSSYTTIFPLYTGNYIDHAYVQNETYITKQGEEISSHELYYPSRILINSNERLNENMVNISSTTYSFTLSPDQSTKAFSIPKIGDTENHFYADVYSNTTMVNNTPMQKTRLSYLLPFTSNTNPYSQILTTEPSVKLFSINNTVLPLSSALSFGEKYLGQVLLETKKANKLRIYTMEKARNEAFRMGTLYPYRCAEDSFGGFFGAEEITRGFSLYGKLIKTCVDFPLEKVLPINVVSAVKLSFDFDLEGEFETQSAPPPVSFCLFDEEQKQCILSKKLSSSPLLNQSFEGFFHLDKDNVKTLVMIFSLDAKQENQITTVSVYNMGITSYPQERDETFFTSVPPLQLRPEKTNSLHIKGQIPYNDQIVHASALDTQTQECGFEQSESLKKEKHIVGGDDMMEYRTIDGSQCEALFFPSLSQDMGYIVEIESQHMQGLPLKLCIENEVTKTCVLEDELHRKKTTAKEYFIIPPYYQGFGYNVILNNFSIGKTETINRLKSVRVIPFPYNFFQSIQTGTKQMVDQSTPLIMLDEAYEKNWRAYAVSETTARNPLLALFAPLVGKELKNHVLVNNWANGWVVENQSEEVVIVFLPQYLEFVGFILLFGALIFIARYPNR
ncbi:MAG TPA: hypothetical protein VJH96_04185 [Patescibacteria group bacterium]|nr:hypothetical protein [Patescibacteria group bacterium]